MSEAGVCADGRLPDELVERLEPKLQGALNHPTRREILRILHGAGRPCSTVAILSKLPSLRRGEVNYHVQVLQDAGAVFVEGTRPAFGGRDVLYQSALEEDSKACAVLRATERGDRRRRQAEQPSRSSSLLTMFRIPHADRAVTLGRRRERKTDREG